MLQKKYKKYKEQSDIAKWQEKIRIRMTIPEQPKNRNQKYISNKYDISLDRKENRE